MSSSEQIKILNFNDALALFRRAKTHHRNFIDLTRPDSKLWQVSEHVDLTSLDWVYEINFDEAKLTETKIVLADCANNYRSCLDHVISELARQKSKKRPRIYFPRGRLESENFDRELGKLIPFIDDRYLKAIEMVCRSKPEIYLCAEAILFISNSVKHWKLVHPKIDSCAISAFDTITHSGYYDANPIIRQTSDLSYEIYREYDRLENYEFSVNFSMQLSDIPDDLPKSVKNILSGIQSFIQEVVTSVQIAHNSILDES